MAPKDKPKGSLAGRAWQMIRHNPGMIRSVLREEYRRRWGISLDRRYRQGCSSPPVSLSLNLTRRCNLKCRMCEQHRHQSRSSTALSWYDPARELPLAAAQGRLRLQFLPNLPGALLASYYLDLNYPFPQVCQDLWKGCRILPDGTVSPCLHLVAGNITRQPFREIWNGPQMQRFRQLVSRRLFPGCARCCSRNFT